MSILVLIKNNFCLSKALNSMVFKAEFKIDYSLEKEMFQWWLVVILHLVVQQALPYVLLHLPRSKTSKAKAAFLNSHPKSCKPEATNPGVSGAAVTIHGDLADAFGSLQEAQKCEWDLDKKVQVWNLGNLKKNVVICDPEDGMCVCVCVYTTCYNITMLGRLSQPKDWCAIKSENSHIEKERGILAQMWADQQSQLRWLKLGSSCFGI